MSKVVFVYSSPDASVGMRLNRHMTLPCAMACPFIYQKSGSGLLILEHPVAGWRRGSRESTPRTGKTPEDPRRNGKAGGCVQANFRQPDGHRLGPSQRRLHESLSARTDPRMEGQLKPTVSAPGRWILSTLAHV